MLTVPISSLNAHQIGAYYETGTVLLSAFCAAHVIY